MYVRRNYCIIKNICFILWLLKERQKIKERRWKEWGGRRERLEGKEDTREREEVHEEERQRKQKAGKWEQS